MTWAYDEEVSGAMLQDQQDLNKLGSKLMEDLDLLGYFTQIKFNDTILQTTKVTSFKLQKTQTNQLKLHFTLPLKKPVQLQDKFVIHFIHEDPTAVAILYYDKSSSIDLNKPLASHCLRSVIDKKGFDEGEFPQIVTLNCNL